MYRGWDVAKRRPIWLSTVLQPLQERKIALCTIPVDFMWLLNATKYYLEDPFVYLTTFGQL
jgi:hypothetical protein